MEKLHKKIERIYDLHNKLRDHRFNVAYFVTFGLMKLDIKERKIKRVTKKYKKSSYNDLFIYGHQHYCFSVL